MKSNVFIGSNLEIVFSRLTKEVEDMGKGAVMGSALPGAGGFSTFWGMRPCFFGKSGSVREILHISGKGRRKAEWGIFVIT